MMPQGPRRQTTTTWFKENIIDGQMDHILIYFIFQNWSIINHNPVRTYVSCRSWVILAARHGESDVPPCLILFWLWTSNRSNTSDMWACVQPSFPSSFFTQPFQGKKGPPTSDIHFQAVVPTPHVPHAHRCVPSTEPSLFNSHQSLPSGNQNMVIRNPCQFMCFLDKIITENLYKRMKNDLTTL